VDNTADSITENLNEGTDSVFSTVTYTLTTTDVENLTLQGTTAINVTGNTLNNIITGNTGNNVLSRIATNLIGSYIFAKSNFKYNLSRTYKVNHLKIGSFFE
jgi:hypothetical protein